MVNHFSPKIWFASMELTRLVLSLRLLLSMSSFSKWSQNQYQTVTVIAKI